MLMLSDSEPMRVLVMLVIYLIWHDALVGSAITSGFHVSIQIVGADIHQGRHLENIT